MWADVCIHTRMRFYSMAEASYCWESGWFMVEAPQAGARVGGKYVLVSHIADGGMGSVWTAQNAATSSDVAVKLWRRRSGDDGTVERLRQEARLGSRLSHRNIVRIFDLVEEAEGPLVLVMELLRGCSLERYLQQRGALEPKAAVGIVVAMLAALSEAHDKGIIHRDIKPANVFLAADHDGHVIPKLLDFGIAKMPVENKNLTEDGRSLGTPRYMSPEQIRGTELDGKSDVFSAAVVLYEALTNVSPFDSGSSGAMLAAVLEREVDPHPLIPPRVWIELSRALSKRAYERHGSARELKDALVAAMQTSESELEDALKRLDPLAIAPLPPRPPQSSVQEIIVPLPTGSRPEPRFSLAAKAVAGFGAAAALGPHADDVGRGHDAGDRPSAGSHAFDERVGSGVRRPAGGERAVHRDHEHHDDQEAGRRGKADRVGQADRDEARVLIAQRSSRTAVP